MLGSSGLFQGLGPLDRLCGSGRRALDDIGRGVGTLTRLEAITAGSDCLTVNLFAAAAGQAWPCVAPADGGMR